MNLIEFLILASAVVVGVFLGIVAGWLTIAGLLGTLAWPVTSSRRRRPRP